MQITVQIDELRKRKIMIGTPMYGGQCAGMFAKSTADLTALTAKYNMDLRLFFIFNESLITRARNYICDEFMRSDCTHLMFIDSDIGYDPNDVIALAALADENDDKDIICGPYPKKCISWEKVKRAVDKGLADEDPNNLANFVGDYVFNPVPGTVSFRIDQPVEVLESGTGFMMIKRKVFEEYAKAYPTFSYRPDHVRTQHFDGSREIMMYFQAEIDPASKRYLSEDYLFCQNARKIGLKVWLCPWMHLAHVGGYIFDGTLANLAAIGANPTADIRELKRAPVAAEIEAGQNGNAPKRFDLNDLKKE